VTPLRVALLDQADGGQARQLDAALRAAGHEPRLIGSRAVAQAEALLRRRGFTPALTHVPFATLELQRADVDLAHAFTAPDAAAALAWRRLGGGPVVFTCCERIDRGSVANARQRLATLTRALGQPDAVVAVDDGVRADVERWFALSLAVVPAGDVHAHEALYRKLLAASAG